MPKCLKHYKDKDKARAYTYRRNKKYYTKHMYSQDIKKKRWSDFEVKIILDHKFSDVVIAMRLQRSVRAIQVKRCKLKHSYYYICPRKKRS